MFIPRTKSRIQVFDISMQWANGDVGKAFAIMGLVSKEGANGGIERVERIHNIYNRIVPAVSGENINQRFDKFQHFATSADWRYNSGEVSANGLQYLKETLDEARYQIGMEPIKMSDHNVIRVIKKHWPKKHPTGYDKLDMDANNRGEMFAEEILGLQEPK